MKLRRVTSVIVGSSVALAIALVNIILASSLREKDMAEAHKNALEKAQLIKSGLLNTMIATGDYEYIAKSVESLKKGHDFDFRMVRAPHVTSQHGKGQSSQPMDEHETSAIETGQIVKVMDDRTTLRFILPFVTDERCGGCHTNIRGQPVKAGVVNGAAVLTFDLSAMQYESLLVILKAVILMTLIMSAAGLAIVFAEDRLINRPMRAISRSIRHMSQEKFDIMLPRFSVDEIEIVADSIRKTGEKLANKKYEREKRLSAHQVQSDEVEKLVRLRAKELGLTDVASNESLIGGLVHVIGEAERVALIQKAVKYIEKSGFEIAIPSDPDLVPAVSVYLSSQLSGIIGQVKRQSVELALDEAIHNAIIHGNLEIASPTDEDSMEETNELTKKRMKTKPYSERKVRITSRSDIDTASFLITDEGPGFDWKSALNSSSGEKEKIFGRGLLILRALTKSVEYNEKGDTVNLTFDLST